MNKKFGGFTLAEVLITLGVIGVVAAMTIPNLIATYKAKQLQTQFLKSYSTIQQVFKHMESDDISLDPSSYQQNGTYYKVFGQYLKGATDCGHGNQKLPKPCRAYRYTGEDDYKALSETTNFQTSLLDDGSWLMPDGSILFFENNNSDLIIVSVDLNGFSTPTNIAGYDLFSFQFIEGELKAMGAKGTLYENDTDRYCNRNKLSGSLNGITCANKAKNDSMYFKNVVKRR